MSEIYTLVPGSNSGRYALDEPDGPDITSGQSLEIRLGETWIPGRVEYSRELYVNMGMQYWGEPPREPRVIDGYYFEARGGGICGLCAGMEVRL